MPACMCIVHQSCSADTSHTVHHNPLQTITTDSVSTRSASFCEKRPDLGTKQSEVRKRWYSHTCCKMQVLHVQMLQHMHMLYHSQMRAYQQYSLPSNATAYMKLIIFDYHLKWYKATQPWLSFQANCKPIPARINWLTAADLHQFDINENPSEDIGHPQFSTTALQSTWQAPHSVECCSNLIVSS